MIMKTLRSIFFLSLCLLLSIAGYAGDKASFLKKQFTARDGYQLNYRVLYPRDYNPAQKYPVILFLHGAGELIIRNSGERNNYLIGKRI